MPGDPRRCSRSPTASRDRSHRRSVPSCRSIAASSIVFAPPGGASSVRRAPRRSSNAARCSRRASWRVTGFRPRAIACATSAADARAAIASGEFGFPVVLKADGLAAGKGVVVAADRDEADARDPRRDGRSAVRRRRRAAGDRRVPGRSRGVVLRAVRRHARDPDRFGAGSQAHLRRRPGAEHRRDGRVRAEPAARRRDARRDHARRSSIRCCAGCAPRAPSTAAFSMPA